MHIQKEKLGSSVMLMYCVVFTVEKRENICDKQTVGNVRYKC